MSKDESSFSAGELGISAPQAAHALGVSLSTIYSWSDLGYLESDRTASGQRRFSRERIDGFISLLERQRLDTPARPSDRLNLCGASSRSVRRLPTGRHDYNPDGCRTT